MPFLAYPEEIRRVIYTTNAIESVNRGLQKDHQEPRLIPDRRVRTEVALPCVAEHLEEVDNADKELEGSTEPICDCL